MPKFRVYFEKYAEVEVEADCQENAENRAMRLIGGYAQTPEDKLLSQTEGGWEQIDMTEEIDENGEVI